MVMDASHVCWVVVCVLCCGECDLDVSRCVLCVCYRPLCLLWGKHCVVEMMWT